MTKFGAMAYQNVSVETAVKTADPHQLVLMLYDGAIAACQAAGGHIKARRHGDKALALSKATRIVDEGLKVSLDTSAGGELALRLRDLYDYMIMRLLAANLRNDLAALDEVTKLLEDLRGAWAQIRTAPGAPAPLRSAEPPRLPVAAEPAAPAVPVLAAVPALRRFEAAYAPSLRRVATA